LIIATLACGCAALAWGGGRGTSVTLLKMVPHTSSSSALGDIETDCRNRLHASISRSFLSTPGNSTMTTKSSPFWDFGKGYEWLTEPPALEVAAQPFLATLNELGNLTQDPRFHELRNAIMATPLINKDGNWAAAQVLNLGNPRVRDLGEKILEAIGTKRGSRRVILAKVAAEMQIRANSFEAAHARLTVLWRAWKRWKSWQLKSQKPSSNSNS
jgi:hypothetical protein